MCIAAICFTPVPEAHLRAMEADNPHGAGVAWAADGQLHFRRGLTAAEILAMQASGVLTLPYALHFRWATQGAAVPELTHPFPLGPRALGGELTGTADQLLIHNGTWHAQDRAIRRRRAAGGWVPPEAVIDEASDTAIAAWLAADEPDLIDEILWATALLSLDQEGQLDAVTAGTWTTYAGNWYSNLNWLPSEEWGPSRYVRGGITRRRGTMLERSWASLWYGDDEGEGAGDLVLGAPDVDEPEMSEDGWLDYVRAKYGDEVARGAARAEASHATDKLAALNERLEDLNAEGWSDDPEIVNSYLAREMLA